VVSFEPEGVRSTGIVEHPALAAPAQEPR
jgi:hypothetical protein